MALTNIGIYDPLAAEAFHQVLRRAEGQRAENNLKKSVRQGRYPQRSAVYSGRQSGLHHRVRNRAARRAHWSPVLRADATLKYPLIGVIDAHTKEQWVQHHFQYFCGSTDSAGIWTISVR